MYEFAVMRGGTCDVSSLWAAGNMEVEVLPVNQDSLR